MSLQVTPEPHARRVGAAPSGGQPAAQRRLGNVANYASTGQSETALATRFMLQDAAASLLPRERVACCLRCGRSKELGGVKVVYSPSTGKARYDNVQTCGSVWICPICMAKISEKRRQHLQEAFERGTVAGLYWAMLTLTFSHGKNDVLKDILGAVCAAWRWFVAGRGWKAIKHKYGIIENIRALETTHSWLNGWHPHHHVLLVFKAPLSEEMELELKQVLSERWLLALEQFGLTGDPEVAAVLTSQNDYIASYISKFGVEPKKDPVGNQARSFEIAKQNSKSARRKGVEHRNYLQILEDYARDGLKFDAELIVEYAKAFKGRRQLMPSRGFWALFGMDSVGDLTDEQIVAEIERDEMIIADLPVWMWAYILKMKLRAALLVVVAFGDWELVGQWFMQHFNCLPPLKEKFAVKIGMHCGATVLRAEYGVIPLVCDAEHHGFMNSPQYLEWKAKQREKERLARDKTLAYLNPFRVD